MLGAAGQGKRTLGILSWVLVGLTGCTIKPNYCPVSDAVMRKLGRQIQEPAALGIEQTGAGIAFESFVEGPDVVTVPLARNRLIPTVQCWLNNNPEAVPMMFDTGAQISVIDADTAVANGIGIIDPRTTNITVMGVMGREPMLAGVVAPLSLDEGRSRITKQLCLVRMHRNEARMFGPFMRERVSMDLLGFDVLRQWCRFVTIDYPQARMTFGFKQDFKPPKLAANVWREPLILKNGLPEVVLESRGVRWLALLDTGSAFGVEVNESIAAELGVLRHARPVESGMINASIGGMADVEDTGVKLARVRQIDGLGPALHDVEIAISPGGPRVGSFLLKDYRVTLDLKRQVLWLER